MGVKNVRWKPCWRLIPTLYPEQNILKELVDASHLDTANAIEQMTNERAALTGTHREIVTGAGSEYIMASFAYLNPAGSRFSDGTYGVFYAAHELATAVEEVKYHREKFLRATNEDPMLFELRILTVTLEGPLEDIRGLKNKLPDVYSPTSYSASQRFAVKLAEAQSFGIVYDSVRRPKGQCAAVFRPSILRNCKSAGLMMFQWDGTSITVYRLDEYKG